MKVLLVFLALIFFLSCERRINPQNAREYLPTHAENVTDEGNGWVKFSLDGHHYLFYLRRDVGSSRGFAALTEIRNETITIGD